MMNRRCFLACSSASVGALIVPNVAFAQTADAAVQHVKRITDQVTAVIIAPGDLSSKHPQFRRMFEQTSNVRKIAGFSLGRYARTIRPEQKSEYIDLFTDYTVQVFSSYFVDYEGETMRVVRTVDEGNGRHTVYTEFLSHDGARVRAAWNIASKNGAPLVEDIVVENVSLAMVVRDEFTSMIRQRGGDIDAFIAALRGVVANRLQ